MKQFLIALDQLLNTLCVWLPGGCWADESLSSRAWRIRAECPKLYRLINGLFFWDTNHCEESYQGERERNQSPPEMRA